MTSLVINLLAVAVGVIAIRSWRREGASRADIRKRLGFSTETMFNDIVKGAVAASIAMCVLCAVYWTAGWISIHGTRWRTAFDPARIATIAFGVASEEIAFRGFLLAGLVWKLRHWGYAILLSSIMFGAAHLGRPNATLLSTVSTMIGGVMYSLPVMFTSRINYSLGVHFAWNWVQGVALGFPMSGIVLPSVVEMQVSGPVWLTGGDYGPEGGMVGIGARVVVILLSLTMLWRVPSQAAPS